MIKNKKIGLVAHDNRKKDLIEWLEYNYDKLMNHTLICTGTTGTLVEKAMLGKITANKHDSFPPIVKLKSGPLGGDQQLGAMIAEGEIDMLVFLWDPMQPQPHDVDVKALLRLAVLYNVPTANNRSTADFLVTSSLFDSAYKPTLKDYSSYLKREVD